MGKPNQTMRLRKRKVRWNSLIESESGSDVIFLVGPSPDVQRIPAHSWILAESNPVFKAMFRGPLSELRHASSSSVVPGTAMPITDDQPAFAADTGEPARGDGARAPSSSAKRRVTITVSDVDGRAFDILLRYLYNETVQLQSVMTALTTLYAAHKYMCPGLAKIVVKYLKENLSEKNVLLVLQHICLYCAGANPQPLSSSGSGHDWDVPITESPRRAYFASSTTSEVEAAAVSAPRPSSRFTEIDGDDEFDGEDEDGAEFDDSHIPSAPPLEEDPLLEVEDDYTVGLASSMAVRAGSKPKANCCQSLMKDCLEFIDARATDVLESEDIEDIDISALKMVICRETLCLRSELDVYQALLRWSGRECKRQKIEITRANRREVLEGAQYLVRYLTLNQEDFIEASGLLSEEENDSLLSIISCEGHEDPLPDHLIGCQNIMKAKRRGKAPPHGISLSGKRFSSGLGRMKKRSKKESKRALAEKERRVTARLHKPEKEKFNIIEEFFVCLACIFD